MEPARSSSASAPWSTSNSRATPAQDLYALTTSRKKAESALTLEVQQQLGDGIVRTIALGSSDGLRRGMKVGQPGKAITVPVGRHARPHHGRAGQPDRRARPGRPAELTAHPPRPGQRRAEPTQELLETGIKVIDLVPFAKGGKVGLFGGAGVGKTVNMMELINNIARAPGCRCSPAWASAPARATTSGTR